MAMAIKITPKTFSPIDLPTNILEIAITLKIPKSAPAKFGLPNVKETALYGLVHGNGSLSKN
jgi:hypothetical protein